MWRPPVLAGGSHRTEKDEPSSVMMMSVIVGACGELGDAA